MFLTLLTLHGIAVAQISKGDRFFELKNYRQAIAAYESYLAKKQSPNPQAIINLAESYRQTNNFNKSEYWYRKTVHLLVSDSIHKVHYGQVLKNNNKYDEAASWFQLYLYDHPNDVQVQQLLASCDSNHVKRADSNQYEIERLAIPSSTGSFAASWYRKGYVSAMWDAQDDEGVKKSKEELTPHINLYYTPVNSRGDHLEPFILPGFLHVAEQSGPAAFSPDFNTMYYSRSILPQGKILRSGAGGEQTTIYTAEFLDNKWQSFKPLFQEDGGHSFGHPALSPDGLTMYFASDRPGGYGGFDLYYSVFKNGTWTFPSNLGHQINTAGDELFPSVATVNGVDVLYFASDGRLGLGGLDIYYSQLERNKWSEPNHLSFPINSSRDDFGLIMSSSGNEGYLTTNRFSDEGMDQVLKFKITKIDEDEVKKNLEAYEDSLKNKKGGVLGRIFKGKKKDDEEVEIGIGLEKNKKAGTILATRLNEKYPGFTFKDFIYVDVKNQMLFYVRDEKLEDLFEISTSKYGVGQLEGSEQTPGGLHIIRSKIGNNVPYGGIIKYRAYTGKVASIECDPISIGTDDCTTRILWLGGAEYGFNSGGKQDSHARHIYIHGTPEEGLLGIPSSHGCIRMGNGEIISLFDRVKEGTAVAIMPD